MRKKKKMKMKEHKRLKAQKYYSSSMNQMKKMKRKSQLILHKHSSSIKSKNTNDQMKKSLITELVLKFSLTQKLKWLLTLMKDQKYMSTITNKSMMRMMMMMTNRWSL